MSWKGDSPDDPFLVNDIRYATNRGETTDSPSDLQLFDNFLVGITQDWILKMILGNGTTNNRPKRIPTVNFCSSTKRFCFSTVSALNPIICTLPGAKMSFSTKQNRTLALQAIIRVERFTHLRSHLGIGKPVECTQTTLHHNV